MEKTPKKAPWRNPKPKTGAKMTPEMIQVAKTRAAKAGRPYPNLIDNMAVIREAKKQEKM